MAGETGSARQEAERLVATVLAMASQSGPGDAGRGGADKDDTISGTSARIVEGLGTLGDTLAGLVGHLAGAGQGTRPSADSPATGETPGNRPADDNAEDSSGGDAGTSSGGGAAASSGGGAAASSGGDTAASSGGDTAASSGRDAQGTSSGDEDVWGAATRDATGDARAADPKAHAAGAHDGGTGMPDWGEWASTVRGWVSAGSGPARPVRYGFATGSVECCVCPICRTISSLRNPTPESAARLASGAGDFATGVASLMRAFSAISGSRPRTTRPSRPAPPPPDPDLAWSAATRNAQGGGRHEAPDLGPDQDESPWAAATRAPAAAQKPATPRTPGAAAEGEGRDPASPAATPEPRTANGSSGDAEGARRSGPAPHGRRPGDARDVWAAATTDVLEGRDGGLDADATELGTEADRETRDDGDARSDAGPRNETGPQNKDDARINGDPRDDGVTGNTPVDHDDAGGDARSGEV